MFFCLFVFCCSEPHTCARLLIDGLIEEKTRCVWTLSSPWRRCHKTPRCCWGTVCWDRRVRRTERRRRPDLSPSSRCSATPWGSWSHPCPSLPSSWTWLRWPVHLGAVGIKKRKKENWLSECGRVWHWREWLFLPILFRVELRSRREKFTCASKPWLCVKRELETVRWMTKKNCKARQLSSRRSSWVTVNLRSGSQCKQLSLSLSSLSRVVALGARGGTVVSVRVRRKSTLKRKSYAYLKTSVYTYKGSLSEVRIRAVIEVYIFWWWLKRWVGTDWALKQFECSIQTRCFFLFF